MILAEFSVYTEVTGRERRVDVRVFDTQENMCGEGAEDYDAVMDNDAAGMTITSKHQDPANVHFADIRLFEDGLTPYVIAHEATHAALKIYSVDMLYSRNRVKARATSHVTVHNETLCYLVGELTHKIMDAVMDHGLLISTKSKEDDNEGDNAGSEAKLLVA